MQAHMNIIKNAIQVVISSAVNSRGHSRIGSFILDQVLDSVTQTAQSLTRRQAHFIFTVPNRFNRFRVSIFSVIALLMPLTWPTLNNESCCLWLGC